MQISRNLKRVEEIQKQVSGHIIGGSLKEGESKFHFIFHTKHFGFNGVSVHKAQGKAMALKQLAEKLDGFYNKECGHSANFKPLKTVK